MYYTIIPPLPLAALKAELQSLRAAAPTILHQAIDARLDAIAKTEAAIK